VLFRSAAVFLAVVAFVGLARLSEAGQPTVMDLFHRNDAPAAATMASPPLDGAPAPSAIASGWTSLPPMSPETVPNTIKPAPSLPLDQPVTGQVASSGLPAALSSAPDEPAINRRVEELSQRLDELAQQLSAARGGAREPGHAMQAAGAVMTESSASSKGNVAKDEDLWLFFEKLDGRVKSLEGLYHNEIQGQQLATADLQRQLEGMAVKMDRLLDIISAASNPSGSGSSRAVPAGSEIAPP